MEARLGRGEFDKRTTKVESFFTVTRVLFVTAPQHICE